MPDSLKTLEDVDVKFIVISEQDDFDGVYETIESISNILNARQKADNIISGMKNKVAEVVEKVKDLPKPKTYYVMSYGEFGEYTATGDTFLGKMISMAGGDNIAGDATGWKFNLEDIVAQDPEILLVSPMSGMITDPNSALANANGYKDLTAIREKKAVLVDDDLINRQGPRLAEGLEHLARAIHPEVFQND
jgi:iron complex transport system substrate-binding protein